MGGTARRQEAEGLREYFDVQLRFAQVLAARTSRPLAETCLAVTNLHRRLGLGRAEADAPSAGWACYAEGLEARGSGAERLDWTVAFFASVPPEPGASLRFGCFSYELQDEDRVVRIHFSNRDADEDSGPLAGAKADRRRAELREMFSHVRVNHPQAQRVRGGSWLYNLEAYRRLFPPEYGGSRREPERVRLDGTSSWGQVLDFRGAVKPAVRQALLANAATVDPAAPWRAFPLRALVVESAIGPFHQRYGG
ncbi:MAG: hypothetical protein V4656_00975 [Pseudomonadota bacterium]